MRQIAIYGKGGIGKSTLSAHISAALSQNGSISHLISFQICNCQGFATTYRYLYSGLILLSH